MSGVWPLLATIAPGSIQSCFALSWAALIGALAYLAADAVRQRRALRPTLKAVVAATLLAPVGVAAPLWLGLLAAAGMLATPAPRRLVAANDNAPPERLFGNPFALTA